MDQTTQSSGTIWYVIGAIIIIALAFWYFSASPVSAPTANTQTPSDTTTAAIANDFSQIPDSSAALDADAAAAAQAVQGF